MSLFLPFNVRRSTFGVQRSALFTRRSTHDARRTGETDSCTRSGMTMIELLAALALFVVVLGSLLTILNSATSLWSSSRSQQREQAAAQSLLDLLADDLQNAVTDSGVPTNTPTAAKPTFILDSRTNSPANEVLVMLQFARHAIPHTSGKKPGIPVSLDAVFYTFAGNALFRHVIPLSQATFADAQPLGDLLDEHRAKIDDPSLHAQILESLRDPGKTFPASADWSCSVLATRIDVLGMLAAVPERYVRKTNFHKATEARLTAAGLSLPPEYDYLETDVLPDRLDVALRLHNEEDWNTLSRLAGQSTEEADRTRQLLGLKFSRRITFPAQGGSRLP